jgi:hypothetical protein
LLRERHDEYLTQTLDRCKAEREFPRESPSLVPAAPLSEVTRDELIQDAVLLGDLGDPAGVPALRWMAACKDPMVAYMAKEALAKIEAAQTARKPGESG